MSSRRDHPTHTTGAHRAHSVRRPKRHQRSGASKVFSRSGASSGRAADSGPAAEASAAADAPAGTAGTASAAGASAGATSGPTAGAVPPPPEGRARARTSRGAAASVADGPASGSVPTAVATAASGQAAEGSPESGTARYEPYLDGLFTYCLSVMCEHDAAISAVGETLVIAERQFDRDRAPVRRTLHRPWLYALARWVCLRRLAEQSGRDGKRGTVPATAPHLTEAARTQRRRDLAALAWPEAAGTTPEQREALELAVRHGLPAHEVAAVLSLSAEAASVLLSQAACEVERTRAALAVVKSGGCRVVSGLAGEDQLLLGPAFRRELVKHVDECTHCRRAAERAMSGVAWPGTAPAGTAVLAVLEAPRPAVEAAVLAVRRARCRHTPRFDKTGFPMEIKDRGARRDRLRSRAVTTTVVATVVAAPVLALWAAYRGAPLTGESDGSSISAGRDDESSLRGHPFENAAQGRVRAHDGHRHQSKDADSRKKHGRSGKDGKRAKHGESADGRTTEAGRLSVDARAAGDSTLIRLSASGSSPVRWSMSGGAPWLAFSRTSGVLSPGETMTVRVTVIRSREPAGYWSAHIRVAPSGAVVTMQGRGSGSSSPTPPPSEDPTPPPSDDPTSPPPSDDPSTPPPSDPPSSGGASSSAAD
ncbi:sigma-70 family RNA polymerase sigma factor [Streptomyces sp. HNM0575]|uniref:RNA polymerase sigma factor n=1 Tax=Streptomyces sp. HNM0575 TaxID=2716338 RepID=UPI00145F3DC8|nr:sigma-70 family RNA polymerase sigma factor [Streptomyces sp. HNM0575]NLU75421.1 sigma-70 family RNA polymerase sigma factor [Streptomyces sp. HNM0575]